MAPPKRLLVFLFFFSFAVACDRAITEPTSGEPTSSSSTLSTPTPPPDPTADHVPTSVTFTGPPAPGCQPASESLEWVVTVASAPELVRLYPHAFRDPVAGCENTVHSLATMGVIGPLHYATGESGQTRFLYKAGDIACGRLELGIIYKDANGHDTMLTWRVVNSGVDCAALPPPNRHRRRSDSTAAKSAAADSAAAATAATADSATADSATADSAAAAAAADSAAAAAAATAASRRRTCARVRGLMGVRIPSSCRDSGNATELAYVQAHVSPLLVGPVKSDQPGDLVDERWRLRGGAHQVVDELLAPLERDKGIRVADLEYERQREPARHQPHLAIRLPELIDRTSLTRGAFAPRTPRHAARDLAGGRRRAEVAGPIIPRPRHLMATGRMPTDF